MEAVVNELYDLIVATPLPPEAAVDCYKLKRTVYGILERVGISVETRDFLYGIDPVAGAMTIRSDDERIRKIEGIFRPVKTFAEGTTVDFCLRASPMREEPIAHCKVPDDPKKWLTARNPALGLEITKFLCRSGQMWCGKGQGFSIPEATWIGQAVVRDLSCLTYVLKHGIGRHKGFGYGMLQLWES